MKKLLIAGAAGAMMFGLTAASASTLNLAGPGAWFHHTVQQSDIATATCAGVPVQVAMQVAGTTVTGVAFQQQELGNCAGSQVQVVAFRGNSGTPYAASTTERIVAGANTLVTFNPALDAQAITRVRVTIADQIVSSGVPTP